MEHQIEVCHGTWVPRPAGEFDNSGRFVFWVETPGHDTGRFKPGLHPSHLADARRLKEFLATDLKLGAATVAAADPELAGFCATMPSAEGRPLPSLEMAQLTGEYLPDQFEWNDWDINGIAIRNPLSFLRELQFLSGLAGAGFHVGHDLNFWVRYAQQLRALVRQHQYLPVMKRLHPKKGRSQPVYAAGWAPADSLYERGLRDFADAMPAACTLVKSARNGRTNGRAPVSTLDRTELLRQFSEQQVDRLVSGTPFTQTFLNRLRNSWFAEALTRTPTSRVEANIKPHPGPSDADVAHWHAWQKKILGQARRSGFSLGFRLSQEDRNDGDRWHIGFFVSCNEDPSLSVDLSQWWSMSEHRKDDWKNRFGHEFERHLLINLGQAGRICPLLWRGMETAEPVGVDIDLKTAYEFLKDDALVLETAGYRIVLPSWWTPKGRRRARLRIRASATSGQSGQSGSSSGLLRLESLVDYDYALSIDGEPVGEDEWRALLEAKSPLVKYRGEWMEIDHQRMSETLELWRNRGAGNGVEFSQMIREMAEADPDTEEFVFDDALGGIVKGLMNLTGLEPMDTPAGMRGELRAYQKTGLAWLARQERLGLNPCLADDMGLGKTIQLIALLLHERECEGAARDSGIRPTLLVAPTSVLSNWKKEVGKFAPELECRIHHGPGRPRDDADFARSVAGCDLVVTSFNLVRSDKKTLKAVEWRRIVVDEAQNIKNPKSAQARAIFELPATSRVAMTGTPIENRLMDMWSLFRFLNPGYLGTARSSGAPTNSRFNGKTTTSAPGSCSNWSSLSSSVA